MMVTMLRQEIYTHYLFHNSYQYNSIMRPYTYTPKSHIRPYIRNTLLLIKDQLPLLHLHVNYLSQLQLINRRRLHDFYVLSGKRHTREGLGQFALPKSELRMPKIGSERT